MRALIDGDILRYEIGFAAETGWRAIKDDPEALPPFDYVRDMLNQRIGYVKGAASCHQHTLYLTEGPTFRYDIATVKPYKGNRKDNKPWHFDNLTVYMRDILNAVTVTGIEADDAMAIEQLRVKGEDEDETVICSRDKDLRQVPGRFYSWELGRQPAYGPLHVTRLGHLSYDAAKTKLSGSGYAFFAAQVLMGDTADNIPGLPKMGPKGAADILIPLMPGIYKTDETTIPAELEAAVAEAYDNVYGSEGEARMEEQAKLCWIVRRLNEDGSPVVWQKGTYE